MKLWISISLLILLAGCSLTLPQVKSQYPIVTAAIVDGQTRVVIYNATSPVMFTASGRLNMTIDGKEAAQLDIGEYIELSVPLGKHKVDLVHHDVLSFSSSHEVDLSVNPAYLEIEATIISNSARVVPELPAKFKEVYYRR